LLPQQPYGTTAWGDPDAANAFVAATNDFFLQSWVGFDRRYGLAVTVPPHDPRAAAEEIRRHAGQPGVIAVQLLLMDRMLGDTWYDPIYAAACEAGLPIAVHQSGSEGCFTYSQGPAGGIPRSYGERHSVLTQVGAANVVDAVVNGAFDRFPELKIIMVEWGFSWLSAVTSRLDLFWQRDPSQAPRVRQLPSKTVAKHFTFTTQPLDEVGRVHRRSLFAAPGLRELLLFSSDYPHYDTDSPRYVLSGQFPEDFRAAVCYENALRVFGPAALRAA
jgi:predicted TIM-barrel fold metal-dependent hydrolase